jgi:hypothetical protein
MLNNLTIISGDHGYGYDSYYLARKNEELKFPSNATIASSFGATNYEVKNVSLPVEMIVKGTLVTLSETENGYSAGVAKHIEVMDKVVSNIGNNINAKYYLGKVVVDGNLEKIVRGTIYVGGTAVQTFTVDRDSREVLFKEIGEPTHKCSAGTFGIETNPATVDVITNPDGDQESYLSFTWNTAPGTNNIVVDYEYLSSNLTSVLSKTSPIADEYNNVSVYGLTSIETKYIKIMTNFKCKIPVGYTYVKSRTFYTRCKRGNSFCSSYSNAIVPAITVCNQRLF